MPAGEISAPSGPHLPVLLDEVIAALQPLGGRTVLDGTFGAGGYSRALLELGAEVLAVDRDPAAAAYAEPLMSEFRNRFTFLPGTFSELDRLAGDRRVDAVVLDIGVSSMQLDEAERGFSFMREGPLDMRMSQSGESAADLVNGLDEDELANVLYVLGEERKSRRIARAVVAARADAPIATTAALAALIERTIGRKPGESHPATRSFQALRIAINAEFDQLVEGLFAAERLLPEGGRLAVVSFHSLEDRIVKRFFDPQAGSGPRSRHLPEARIEPARWKPVSKPVKAGAAELQRNPRARSATLRSGRRTDAAPRPASGAGLGVPNLARKGAA